MDPRLFNVCVVEPSLEFLATVGERNFNTNEARRMLIAIAWQESRITHRRQVGGPAKGFWQFEQGGGVHGVRTHQTSKWIAAKVLDQLSIPNRFDLIYDAIEHNDMLACCFARLLLYTDPKPLPMGWSGAKNEERAWQYYIRNWRPGKPHRDTWNESWRIAVEATDAEN